MSSVPLPDSLYDLPDTISNPKLRELYEVICARLRAESLGVQMTTIQELLLERIAHNYIVLRQKEAHQLTGDADDEFLRRQNTFWLQMTREFLANVRGADKPETRDLILGQVSQAMNSVFDDMDPSQAGLLRAKFGAALQEVGL